LHVITGEEGKKGGSYSRHPLFLGFFSRRVNQRADSGGGEWSNAPLLFSAISEGFPAILVF